MTGIRAAESREWDHASPSADQMAWLTHHPLYDPNLGLEIYKYYNPLLGAMTQLEDEWTKVLTRNGYEVESTDASEAGHLSFTLVIYCARPSLADGRRILATCRSLRWSYELESSIHNVADWNEAQRDRWRHESIEWIGQLEALREIRALLETQYTEVRVDLYWVLSPDVWMIGG